MSIDLTFKDNVLYNKLNNYFNNSIKLSLKTKYNIFIITKNDIFYEIDLENWKLQYFILNDDKNIIECTKVEELCNKGVYDLICGVDQYIARINENKFYFIGKNKLDVNEIISDLNIKDVKCGFSHTLFLTSSGEVYALGDNRYGQIGSGCNDHQNTPIKVNGFSDERVIMISCGGWHSLALTESGCVYSWGYNECGQLGIGNTIDSNKPILIALEKIIIERISCGRNHSLLLSNEGVIYAFGENFWGQIGNASFENQVTPLKLNHEIKFTDIAADFSLRISVSLSTDNICYVWGKCKEENFRTPIKTDFGTFAEVFDNYTTIQYKISEQLFEFEDELFRFGYFDRNFEELELLGIGNYGTIVKVREKKTFDAEYFAIKKSKPRNGYEKEFVNEFDKYSLVRHYKNPYIVKHLDAWFENIPDINNERLILYIKIELCETTLKEIIEEIKNDINFYNKNEKMLTPIGYYIASQLYIEIVKAIKYLHKKDIIHRDLNPNNILIKREEFNAFRNRKSKNRIFVKIGGFLLTAIHEYAQSPHDRVRETLKYLAPEVINDKKFYLKSDIYSLGLILKQLFDIDLNRKYINNENFVYDTILRIKMLFRYSLNHKYKMAQKLCNQMIESIPKSRPVCEQVLKNKHYWALNENEFNIEELFKVSLNAGAENVKLSTYDITVSKFLDSKCKVRNGGEQESYGKILEFIVDLIEQNEYKPKIVQIFLKSLFDYTKEYCWIKDELNFHHEYLTEPKTNVKNKDEFLKSEFKAESYIKLLKKVFDVTMKSVESFPNNHQIQKYALLLISDNFMRDIVLLNVNSCIKLALNSMLINDVIKDIDNNQQDINRLSAHICFEYIFELSQEERSQLFSDSNCLEKLIELVRYEIQDSSKHNTLFFKQLLNTLLNVTNSLPNVCEIFVNKGGIDMCLDILNKFDDESYAKNVILHLLAFMSKDTNLKKKIMKEDLILVLRNLMHSTNIYLSFYSTKTFAYICSEGMEFWSITSIDFESILNEILNAVSNFEIPEYTFYTRESFLDLKPLLECHELLAVQLYAVWEILFLCFKEPEEYREMLIEIKGQKLIKEICETTANYTLMSLNEQTLKVFDKKYPDLN